MKKIITVTLMALAFAAVSAQQVEKLFDKYMEDEQFNYIYRKGSAGFIIEKMELDNPEKLNRNIISLKSPRRRESEKMLVLNKADEALQKSFLAEVDKALKADKFENTSYVRNGKENRMSEYSRQSSDRLEEVQVIKNNDGNIVLKWEVYVIKSNNQP